MGPPSAGSDQSSRVAEHHLLDKTGTIGGWGSVCLGGGGGGVFSQAALYQHTCAAIVPVLHSLRGLLPLPVFLGIGAAVFSPHRRGVAAACSPSSCVSRNKPLAALPQADWKSPPRRPGSSAGGRDFPLAAFEYTAGVVGPLRVPPAVTHRLPFPPLQLALTRALQR